MNCPGCGAPLHLDDRSLSAECQYCGAVYLPEKNVDGVRAFDQPSALLCPICAVPLMQAVIARERILDCARCHGNLIPMPVFVVLISALRARRGGATEIAPRPDPHGLDRVTHCPQCHRRMDTHYYAGGGNVILDDCSHCELNWLDAGELMAIANAPDHSLDRRPPMAARE
ncbi:MAG TPA: zf-TFIIB domain-containing protein [Bryobacteraceae bacterium]|nr:zf-TFIIB domain-containing protein [Bryobacteraceae bacterium]